MPPPTLNSEEPTYHGRVIEFTGVTHKRKHYRNQQGKDEDTLDSSGDLNERVLMLEPRYQNRI